MITMNSAEALKVCVYCDTWAGGGIEAFIAESLCSMDRSGLDIDICCAQKDGNYHQARLHEYGLRIIQLQSKKTKSAAKKTIGSMLPMYRLCRKQHYDVVHLNVFHSMSLLLALAARISGVKRIILHSHGAGLRKSRSAAVKNLVHGIGKWLLCWIPSERWAASQEAADFMFPRCFPVRIIPNGIDVRRFRFDEQKREEVRADLSLQDKKVFGCVGRLDSQKNQMFLLELMQRLRSEQTDIMLLLVGEGEEMPKLKSKEQEMGILGNVLFYGYSTSVQELLWAMDLLLIPSLSEGLCIAALEGQAAGLPVICSAGVPKEVAVCENICFLSLDDPNEWIAAMKKFSANLREGQNDVLLNSLFNIETSSQKIRQGYMGN